MKPAYPEHIWNKIEAYDSALKLVWNEAVGRWDIFRQGKNSRVMVLRLENQDKSYRPLDDRLFRYLINNDGWKQASGDSKRDALRIDRELREYEAKKKDGWRKDFNADITAKAKYFRKMFARVEI